MAARPGEELVATLFSDVHYYYGPPTAKPPHHRFDKGSYVYLFENASQRRARVEIANNAGTPDQDAFNGHLDGAHVQYSHKHSTLVTVTVDGPSRSNAPPTADGQEWHLPTFDPKNETKYMYRLHTVDLYFWTKEDALQFVNGVRRVLPTQQVTVVDEPVPPPPHQDEMSPVVQRLESVAIADPSYQQGRTRDSRTAAAQSFPGPPLSASPQNQETTNFAPMAYNPAAPAAPEVIQHREKTPPPEDGAGNPLVAAATSEHGQPYGVPFQNPGGFSGPPTQPAPVQQSYFPGPPGLQSPGLSQFGQPPPSAGLQSPYHQSSFAGPPYSQGSPASPLTSLPPPPSTAPPAYQTHPVSPPPHPSQILQTQYANYTPGLSSPGLSSPYTPGLSSPRLYTPGAPPGGFSQHQYQSSSNLGLSNTQPLSADYSIHQQVYRPTETEAGIKHNAAKLKPPRGKLEERAGQVEKGVGGFLKKLEKKIG